MPATNTSAAPSTQPHLHQREIRTKPQHHQTGTNVHHQFTKLRVINSFSSDTTIPGLMLSTQGHTYVFNCGEGTQRLCQLKNSVPRRSDILLTRLNWDVAGGLPGYLLTASDLYDPRTRIHGPKNLAHFLATFRNYIFRTSLDLSTNEFGDEPTPYVDERVTITPIPLTVNSSTNTQRNPSPFSFRKTFSFPAPPLEGTPEEILAHKKAIVHEMFRTGVYEEAADDAQSQGDDTRRRRSSLINVNLPSTQPNDISMAYLVTNHDLPGKFHPEKAKALNIPVGRLYAQLKKGESIEIPVIGKDGTKTMRTIRSEEVLGKPIPGKKVLILDIPGLAYVNKVLKNDTLNSEMIKNADVVVHMLADEVASSTDYNDWMQTFKPSSKHLVMAPKLTADNLVLPEHYMFDLDRHFLNDSIFPLAHHAGELVLTSGSASKKFTPAPPLPSPYTDERFITDIRPGSELDFHHGGVWTADDTSTGGEIEVKHYRGNSSKSRTRSEKEALIRDKRDSISFLDATRRQEPFPGSDIEIITLGTGSAIPNKCRNGTPPPLPPRYIEGCSLPVSCTALRIPGLGNMLLDCGEGTLASLKRQFSPAEFRQFFKQLRMIFISHLHADHHLGLIGILKQYAKIQKSPPQDQRQPIFLIGPWRLFASLYEYNQVENIALDEFMIPFSSNNLIPTDIIQPSSINPSTLDVGMFEGFLSSLNIASVETCLVPHCPQAYGVAILHQSGWKIVYSGDCRPSVELAQVGRNATVLIHEATVANSEPQDALEKMHCTTDEAISIGKRMNAKYILLTHFSQKWAKVPEFVLEWSEKRHGNDKKYENVGIAFDHMVVKVGEMWKLPMMMDAFEVMYADERERKTFLKRKYAQTKGRMGGDDGEKLMTKKRKRQMELLEDHIEVVRNVQ